MRQWRHIDGTWQPNDPAAFIQPDAFANDTGIGSTTGAPRPRPTTNSLSGTQMTSYVTATAQWQDHVAGAATVPRRLGRHVATNYTFQSGTWSGPTVTRIAAPDPAFGPPTVRLSNGRVVTNPLATTIRFAYPTRSDGQIETPPLHMANVRVSRTFVLRSVRFDAALDVFNITNNGTDNFIASGGNQTYNPMFGNTQFRQLPRSAQIALRTTF